MKFSFDVKKVKKAMTEKFHKPPFDKNNRIINGLERYFGHEPQKEKVLRHEDFNSAGDTYYASVSASYKVGSRVLTAFLVIFLLFSIITNYQEITFANFYYMIKDISSAVDAENITHDSVSYDSDPRNTYSLYRGGLAVVNPSKVTSYTATGRKNLDISISTSMPVTVSSDKYLLVYDSSGTSFSIFNSFARIYSEDLTFSITDAAIDDDGSFAVVSGSSDSRSVIHYYSKNFKKLFSVSSDSYCFDIDVDKKRDLLVSALYDIGMGTGKTLLVARSISDPNSKEQIEIDSEFPIAIKMLDDKKTALITDRSFRIYDKNFNEIERIQYDPSVITGFYVGDEGAAFSYVSESKNHIIAFDKRGDLVYNGIVYQSVSGIGVYDSYLFVKTDDGVLRINSEKDTYDTLKCGNGKLLVYNSKTVLVCTPSKAEYVVFE